MPSQTNDPIRKWFLDAEELGEFIGIRFGHLGPHATQPEWFFLRHAEYDGIGGLAHLLRERGAEIDKLLQLKHPSPKSWLPLIKSIPKFLVPRRPVRWVPFERGPGHSGLDPQPPSAVAWHAFDESTTTQIRRVCRKAGVTVNSFLLKHLTKAIRPYLADQSSVVPWMVPVNLRGKIFRGPDTSNYSSYVGVRVKSYETVRDVHRNIYAALGRGEHWANWYAYHTGLFLSSGMRKFLIVSERATSQWNLVGFSNLGDWDPEKKIRESDCQGVWLFAPPVLRFQLVGAGCVTFQNRLSLTLQVHPDLTTSSAVPQAWISSWLKEIEMDLVSLLEEPVSVPWYAA